MNKTDLHLHTTASDGTDTPLELVRHAGAAGLEIIAVTDHDTLSGVRELSNLDTFGVKIITGIEFSCNIRGIDNSNCHILGYAFDPHHESIRAAITHGREMRLLKLDKRIEYLRETFGIVFSEEEISELKSYNSVAKPHIANLIIKRGLADSVGEAIDKYLNGVRLPDDRIDAREAVEAILAAGGVPVYAHPIGGEREKRLPEKKLHKRVAALRDMGLMGLECYYSRYSSEEEEMLLRLADEYGMLASAGSDYHGANKTVVIGTLRSDGADISEEAITVLPEILKRL